MANRPRQPSILDSTDESARDVAPALQEPTLPQQDGGLAVEASDSVASAEAPPAQPPDESASQYGRASLDRSSTASSMPESSVCPAVSR